MLIGLNKLARATRQAGVRYFPVEGTMNRLTMRHSCLRLASGPLRQVPSCNSRHLSLVAILIPLTNRMQLRRVYAELS